LTSSRKWVLSGHTFGTLNFQELTTSSKEYIDKVKHKITDCHGFTYPETAWNSMKMIIMNYRFHKFTCRRIQGHNGKSPLNLAGVNTTGMNWIKFSQKNQH
jgi:hypothetical protein